MSRWNEDRRINVKLVCLFCEAPASTEVFKSNDSDEAILTCDTHIDRAFRDK